jgi:Ala-tRNA(Pro) deacylase
MEATVDGGNTYARLIALLDESGAHYRLLDHPLEGRTEIVSAMRGHDLHHAAKCMILMVKLGKKTTKYVLAVIPGDHHVNFMAIRTLFTATYASFASPETAARLAASVPGTILPFSFDPELQLIVDPSLLESAEIYFNAARLDRSVVLKIDDYLSIAAPPIERISELRKQNMVAGE